MDHPKPLEKSNNKNMISFAKKTSLTALFTALLVFSLNSSNAQCFEIESILVDACGLGSLEGENEMIRFKVGVVALNSNNLSANFPTANSFLGICQNGASATATTALNNTITGCGFLKEPTGGILPANANVLFLTSTDVNTTANSFANLNDTLYVIFQCAGNTSGHFGNSSSGIKTFSISFSTPVGCSDVVSWQNSNLIGGNGALVNFDPSGNATFSNNGCQAPFLPSGISASALLSSSLQICPGDSINLFGTLIGSFDSLEWTGGLGTYFNSDNDTTTYYSSISDIDSFYIKIKGFTSCTNGVSDSVLVYFTDSSDISIVGGNIGNLCPGATMTITATGASNYLWNTNATTSSVSTMTGGQYSVTDTTNHCFPDTASIQVNLVVLPTITITENDTSICQGETVTLHANGASNYIWNNNTNTTSINVITSGTYWVNAVSTCPTEPDSVEVTVIQPTNVSISEPNPSSLCSGTSLILHASPASTGYTWSTTETTESISVNSSGVYIVNFHDGVCPNTTASITITEEASPSAQIIGSSSFCIGESLFLDATGVGNFSWSNGDTGNSTLITSTQEITLTATNFCGTDSDVITIFEEDCSARDSIFIPNVITPNNDDLNDVFKIEGNGISNFSGRIYNRWGKLLFEWNNIKFGWNGAGHSEGTYFYAVEVTFNSDEPKTFKGSIQLFK